MCSIIGGGGHNHYGGCEAKSLEETYKISSASFLIPVVMSNKGTHHIATNLIHLHMPVRPALR